MTKVVLMETDEDFYQDLHKIIGELFYVKFLMNMMIMILGLHFHSPRLAVVRLVLVGLARE